MLPYAALVAAGIAFGALTLWDFFAVDDFFFLQINGLRWPGLRELFVHRYLSQDVLFYATKSLFGLHAAAFHSITLAAHITNGILLYLLLRTASPQRDERQALLASVLFLLHPAAYTPMAWVAAGFNELPVLMCALASTLLFLRYLRMRSTAALLGSLALVAIGSAFKQHAPLAILYQATFGYVYLTEVLSCDPVKARRALAVALLPVVAFSAAYAMVIVPTTQELAGRNYEISFAPQVILNGYLRSLAVALNPFPVFREAVGYQAAIPSWFALDGSGRILYRAGIVFAALLASWWAAVGKRERLFAALLWIALAGSLLLPSALVRQWIEYYVYFALPASAALLGAPLARLTRRFQPIVNTRWAAILVLAGLVYATVAGSVLHGTNRLVKQAANAKVVNDYVESASLVPMLHFLPPASSAFADTANGASLLALLPWKVSRVEFISTGGPPAEHVSSQERSLLAFEDIWNRGDRVYAIERAFSAEDRTVDLVPDQELHQAVEIRGRFIEVHLRIVVQGPLQGCSVLLSLQRIGAPGEASPLEQRYQCTDLVALATDGRLRRPLTVPMTLPAPLPGGSYELSVGLSQGSVPRSVGVVAGAVPPPPTRDAPPSMRGGLRHGPLPGGAQATAGAALWYRIVSAP